MAETRIAGDPCPIDEEPLSLFDRLPDGTLVEGKCIKNGNCRFYRGASSVTGQPHHILCNWPRNGSEIWREPLPNYLSEVDWESK